MILFFFKCEQSNVRQRSQTGVGGGAGGEAGSKAL